MGFGVGACGVLQRRNWCSEAFVQNLNLELKHGKILRHVARYSDTDLQIWVINNACGTMMR